MTIAQVGPADLLIQSVVEKKALIGGTRREESTQALPNAVDGTITALAVDVRGEDLFVGTAAGQIVRYDMRDRANAGRAEEAAMPGGAFRHRAPLPQSAIGRSSPPRTAARSRRGRCSVRARAAALASP